MSLIAGNLTVVQKLLDAHQVVWGVCAGAAAHLYGNRRPIQDIDILVGAGGLPTIVQLLQQQQKAVQFDGKRILWRGIKFFDDLHVRRGAAMFPFAFDDQMVELRRRMPLLGTQVQVLAPEDIVAHKTLLNRGTEQGKHDLVDAAGVVRRQSLNLEYLQQRLQKMRVENDVLNRLRELGVEVTRS
jgi:hypothetical protein